jgi:hypothetical protein
LPLPLTNVKAGGFFFSSLKFKIELKFFELFSQLPTDITCYNGWLDLFNVLRKKLLLFKQQKQFFWCLLHMLIISILVTGFIVVITEGIVLRKQIGKLIFAFASQNLIIFQKRSCNI